MIFLAPIEVKGDFFEMLGEEVINFDTFSSSDGVFFVHEARLQFWEVREGEQGITFQSRCVVSECRPLYRGFLLVETSPLLEALQSHLAKQLT